MSPHLAADQPRLVLLLPQEPAGEQAEARRPAAETWQGVTVAAGGQGRLRDRFPPSHHCGTEAGMQGQGHVCNWSPSGWWWWGGAQLPCPCEQRVGGQGLVLRDH